jgi:thiol-disulfide isomerase/thioredoxin
MRRILLCSVLLVVTAVLVAPPRSAAGDKAAKKDASEEEKKGGGKAVRIEGELTADDPFDKVLEKSRHKIHKHKMVAGAVYRIEMNNASKIDPLLRIETARGEQLAMADDIAPDNRDARIFFKPPADGEYRIIATTFEPGETGEATGKYVLTIEELNWPEFLSQKLKPLADKGADLGLKDALQAMQIVSEFEASSTDLAADAYAAAGKLLVKATDAKTAEIGKMMDPGAVRRLKLVGNPLTVHGQTLDGKDFDWSKYKGKVVLVDFWASWCVPCKQEIPNIKKLYEAYHDRGFEVVAVSIDQGKAGPTKYMEQQKLPWICLFDMEPGKDRESLTMYYGIFAIPQAILVDRDGRVVSMSARGEELERLLEKHIGPREKGERDKSDKDKGDK